MPNVFSQLNPILVANRYSNPYRYLNMPYSNYYTRRMSLFPLSSLYNPSYGYGISPYGSFNNFPSNFMGSSQYGMFGMNNQRQYPMSQQSMMMGGMYPSGMGGYGGSSQQQYGMTGGSNRQQQQGMNGGSGYSSYGQNSMDQYGSNMDNMYYQHNNTRGQSSNNRY